MSLSGLNTLDISILAVENMFSIYTSSSNKVMASKLYPISIPSMGNSMMIRRKARGSLAMFQVISTKENGLIICMRGRECYTVTQADTMAHSKKEKSMDWEKRYIKMAILMRVIITWATAKVLESTFGVMELHMSVTLRKTRCQEKAFGDLSPEIPTKVNFTMI
jgi:hypothetical protein